MFALLGSRDDIQKEEEEKEFFISVGHICCYLCIGKILSVIFLINNINFKINKFINFNQYVYLEVNKVKLGITKEMVCAKF